MKKVLKVITSQLEVEGKTVVKVLLPGEVTERTLFLGSVSIQSSIFEDFKNAFKGKLTEEEIKEAKSVFPKKKEENTFVVFINNEFKPVFAFNSYFGNYNKEKRIVVYQEPWKILLGWPLHELLQKRKKEMY